jgi:predicted nucleic acid-binding protein
MNVLADTNILVRGIHRQDPQHRLALHAIRTLGNAGYTVCVVPQNLYELWSVATRPAASNGLALTPRQADRVLSRLEQIVVLFRDGPPVYDEWRRLVAASASSGKVSHDARLVAAMTVHGIRNLLTFNTGDFQRYAEITVLDPRELGAEPIGPLRHP